jgi:uncharacterized protein (PEP-CTERM system associated)
MIRKRGASGRGRCARKASLLATAAACVISTPALAQMQPPAPAAGAGDQPTYGAGALGNAPGPYGLPATPTAPGPVGGPPIFISPILGLQESHTDNANLTESDRRSDFVTRLLAGANGQVNLGRLQGTFDGYYAHDWYARDSNLNGKTVFANAGGTYTLLRDRLWIEADGTVTNGYTTTFGESAVSRSGVEGRAQLAVYRIGPQFQTTVAGLADLAATASFGQVFFSQADSSVVPVLPPTDQIYQVSGRLDTADRLGRFQLLTTAQWEQDNNGYHNSNGVESVYFRVAPRLRLIARAGYERVYQTDAVDISAPLLSAGLEFRPNADSIVTLEGGQRYKRTAWAADANLVLSRTLSLSASYRESIAPDQIYVAGSFAEFVATAALLPPPVVPTTLTPQENLYNEASFNKTGVVRLNLQDPVNQIVFSATWSERQFLRTNTVDRTLTGFVTYQRQMRQDLSAMVTATYGRTYASPVYGPSENYGVTANLFYLLTAKADVRGSYSYVNGRQLSGTRTQYSENVFLIAIEKRF